MLSDSGIADAMTMGDIIIHPYPAMENFQPASVDLTLMRYPDRYEDDFWVAPDEFLLMSTDEYVTLSPRVAGMVAGKSSLARLGLMVECAGFIDPGFSGQITLEIKNVSPVSVKLTTGMPICQMVFFRLDQAAERPYGSEGLDSHYQGQRGPTKSWMD